MQSLYEPSVTRSRLLQLVKDNRTWNYMYSVHVGYGRNQGVVQCFNYALGLVLYLYCRFESWLESGP